jgi:hypothetical protein
MTRCSRFDCRLAGKGVKGVVIQRLATGTPLVVMKSADGWALVAKDGKSLGYVAQSGLVPVQ